MVVNPFVAQQLGVPSVLDNNADQALLLILVVVAIVAVVAGAVELYEWLKGKRK